MSTGGGGAGAQSQGDTNAVLSAEELLNAADDVNVNGSNAYAPTCTIIEKRATQDQAQGEALVSSSGQEQSIDSEPTTDELLQPASDFTTREPPQPGRRNQTATAATTAAPSNEHNRSLTSDNKSSEPKARGRSRRGRIKNPLRKLSASEHDRPSDRNGDGNCIAKEKKVRRRRLRVRNPLRRTSSRTLALSDSELEESQKPASTSLRNKNMPRSLSPRTHEAALMSTSMPASVSPEHVPRKEIKRMQKPVRRSWRNNKKRSKGSQENNSEHKERGQYCPPPSPPNSSHTRSVKILPIRKPQRGTPREDATATTTTPVLKPSRSLNPGSNRRPQQQTRKPPARTQSLDVPQKPSGASNKPVGSFRPGEAKKSMTSLDRGTYHTPPSRERRTRIRHRTMQEERQTSTNHTTHGGTTSSEDLPPRPSRINSVPTKGRQQPRANPTTIGADYHPKSPARRIMFDSGVLESKEACNKHSLEGATAPTQSLSDNDEFYSLGPSEHSRAESNRSFASFDLSEQEPQRPNAVFQGSPTNGVNRIYKKEKKKTRNTDKKKSQGKSRFW